jgi:hypothetical protein
VLQSHINANIEIFFGFCWVPQTETFLLIDSSQHSFFPYAVGFKPFSILFCQNQCKLAKVRVRPHDFQYIRETAYNDAKIIRVTSLDLKKTKQAFIALIADDAANSISPK